MVLSFKNIKYKPLNKIIVLSQIGILGLTSDKNSMVTLHLPVYLSSQVIIKQFKYDDVCSSTDTDCLSVF